MILSSSAGVLGTRLIIILRPSVEPMPIDANDLIEVASEKTLPEPLQSLNIYELFRGNSECNGCGDVCEDVNVSGVDEFKLVLLSGAISDS